MKRINPDTNEPYKHGDLNQTRDKMFWAYSKKTDKHGYFYNTWRSVQGFEKCRIFTENWIKNNPEKHSANCAGAHTRRLKRNPVWVKDQYVEEIKQFYKHAKVLEDLTGVKHHVDHIVPLQGKTVSGLHVPWNLRVIPAIENIRKRNKFETQ